MKEFLEVALVLSHLGYTIFFWSLVGYLLYKLAKLAKGRL